jgi:hypothetical protein
MIENTTILLFISGMENAKGLLNSYIWIMTTG